MFQDFTLIAGPCTLEDDDLNLEIAEALAQLSKSNGISIIFKGSFDKANRTHLNAPRGPGLTIGLERLSTVRKETGLQLLTDIHEPHQAGPVAEVVDVLQIPAFLYRQTDLLTAAGRTGRAVNVKKGQWAAPEEMEAAVHKLRTAGASKCAITERGTAHGYGDLVVDMRSFARLRACCGGAVALFDATHSVQRGGSAHGATGGDPQHIPALARAAVAAGCDGVFLETHPEPSRAPSDGANMLPLERLPELVHQILAIRASIECTLNPALGA